LRGAIREVQDAAITIEQDGTPVSIDHADIAKARLVPDYAALGLSADRDRHQRGGAGRRRPVQ
jgi:ribosome maturation factor RimP